MGIGMLRAYGSSFDHVESTLAEIKKTALRASTKEGYEAGNAAIILGIVTSLLGLSDRDAVQCYCYMLARDMVSAATRMNVIGPLIGQSILGSLDGFIGKIAGLVQEGRDIDLDKCFTGGGIGEGLASAHERLYSRLFNS